MNELKMLTQEEVAELFHSNIATITMLREVGVIRAIKTGRNYMFSQDEVRRFQEAYLGCDVSNKVKAIRSKEIVERQMTSNSSFYNKKQENWRSSNGN